MKIKLIQKRVNAMLIIISIVTACMVNAQLTSMITIQNTCQISATIIWAKSGSAEDIQKAVNIVAAAGGGTVHVPEGDFEFRVDGSKIAANNAPTGVIIPGGVNIIGAGMGRTILRTVEAPSGYSNFYMFTAEACNKNVRISGISFIGYKFTVEGQPWTSGICMLGATDFRIDHCYFEDFSASAIFCDNHYTGSKGANRGVIDHCTFDNPYTTNSAVQGEKVWPYGVHVDGEAYENTWYPITYYLGQYDGKNNIVYIEDCTFTRCRHATVGSTIGGGFYVIRHCSISMPAYTGMIDVHESYSSSPYTGGRGLEAYDNVLIWDVPNYWGEAYAFLMRGGGGVIYNNIIRFTGYTGPYAYAIYAAKRGYNPLCYVKDLYIWGNTLIGISESKLLHIKDEGYGLLQENVDYFLRPPNMEQDGFTYTPYPYPHPLTVD